MAINPLAIGGGVVAAAAVVGGGLYAGGVFSSGDGGSSRSGNNNNEDAKWYPLYEDAAYKNVASNTVTVLAPYQGNYGQTYSKYLVGKDNKSDKWWQKTFKNEIVDKQLTLNDKFKQLKEQNKKYTDLKTLCDEAYQNKLYVSDPNNSGKIKATATSDTEFQESNIWLFCSPSGSKIETLKDVGGDGHTETTKYGGKETYKTDLVSAKTEGKNTWFWTEKQKELMKAALTGEHVFKKLQDKLKNPNGQTANDNTIKNSLRETCEEAYKQEITSSTATYPKNEVFQFCSLSGKSPD